MSIVNMFSRMEDVKKDANKISVLSSDFEQQKNKHTVLSTSIGQMNEKVKFMEDKHRVLTENIANKANLDDVTKLALYVDAELQNLKNDVITRDVFKQNLDEITLCFQEFILSSNTPRPAIVDNRLVEFDEKMKELNDRISTIERGTVATKTSVIRTAFDIDEIPKLELPEKYFKKPEKKK